MPNNKSPCNEGLTKEFYDVFWESLFISSFKSVFDKGELSKSQKQVVIKLIGKKDKDKRLIQNWRPVSLLNVDLKILSKALAIALKSIFLFLFHRTKQLIRRKIYQQRRDTFFRYLTSNRTLEFEMVSSNVD